MPSATPFPTFTAEPTSTPEPTATPLPTATPAPTATPRAGHYEPGSIGFDISFPQCPSNFPANAAFGIIGVNNGRAYTQNPCLSAQFQWARGLDARPAFYINTSNSGPINPNWGQPGPKACRHPEANDDRGCAYNFGWNGAAQAFITARGVTSGAANYVWWLDVETVNSWNGTTDANSAAIQGFFDSLKARGISIVGIYSTRHQWEQITGGYRLSGVPNWVAGASSPNDAFAFCSAGFSGGPVWLVQFQFSGFYGDYACPAAGQ
jgi:hypothetical protein